MRWFRPGHTTSTGRPGPRATLRLRTQPVPGAPWCGADTGGRAPDHDPPEGSGPRVCDDSSRWDPHRLEAPILALWAASCAEHVIDLLESAQPDDPRPREAIERPRLGYVTMMHARAAGGHAMGAARNLRGASAACRVRCWPGRGRRTRRRARTRCRRLCDQGRTCRRSRRRERGRRATRVPMAA